MARAFVKINGYDLGMIFKSTAITAPAGFIPCSNKSIGLSGADYGGIAYYNLYVLLWNLPGLVITATPGVPFRISAKTTLSNDWNTSKLIYIDFTTYGLFERSIAGGGSLGRYQTDQIQGHYQVTSIASHIHGYAIGTIAQSSNPTPYLKGVRDIADGGGSFGNEIVGNVSGITVTTPITDGGFGTLRVSNATIIKNVAVNYYIKY